MVSQVRQPRWEFEGGCSCNHHQHGDFGCTAEGCRCRARWVTEGDDSDPNAEESDTEDLYEYR